MTGKCLAWKKGRYPPSNCFHMTWKKGWGDNKKNKTNTAVFISFSIQPTEPEQSRTIIFIASWSSHSEPGSQSVTQSDLPSLCTPSPWWLWWAAWPSAGWALQSESRTAPQGKLQTPPRSPGTTKHQQIEKPLRCNQRVRTSRPFGPVAFGKPWPRRFRLPGFFRPSFHQIMYYLAIRLVKSQVIKTDGKKKLRVVQCRTVFQGYLRFQFWMTNFKHLWDFFFFFPCVLKKKESKIILQNLELSCCLRSPLQISSFSLVASVSAVTKIETSASASLPTQRMFCARSANMQVLGYSWLPTLAWSISTNGRQELNTRVVLDICLESLPEGKEFGQDF